MLNKKTYLGVNCAFNLLFYPVFCMCYLTSVSFPHYLIVLQNGNYVNWCCSWSGNAKAISLGNTPGGPFLPNADECKYTPDLISQFTERVKQDCLLFSYNSTHCTHCTWKSVLHEPSRPPSPTALIQLLSPGQSIQLNGGPVRRFPSCLDREYLFSGWTDHKDSKALPSSFSHLSGVVMFSAYGQSFIHWLYSEHECVHVCLWGRFYDSVFSQKLETFFLKMLLLSCLCKHPKNLSLWKWCHAHKCLQRCRLQASQNKHKTMAEYMVVLMMLKCFLTPKWELTSH